MLDSVAAAMAQFEPQFFRVKALPRGSLEERLRRHAAELTLRGMRAAVIHAYGAELLPLITGMQWKQSEAVIRGCSEALDLKRGLLDHPIHYRLPDSRGRLGWKAAAVIGRPYNAWDREAGLPTAKALDEAAWLRQTLGVSVWIRPDLSAWYPGLTSLVVASRFLPTPDNASRFGFSSLA